MKKMTDEQVEQWWKSVDLNQKDLGVAVKEKDIKFTRLIAEELDTLNRMMQRHQAALAIERGQVSGHEYGS